MTHIVLLAVGDQQGFIFASSTLPEMLGAAALTSRLHEQWVPEALRERFPGFDADWRLGTHDAELLESRPGRVAVLVADPEAGKSLVTAVTVRALKEAPGLEVRGVVVPGGDGTAPADALQDAEQEWDRVRSVLPGQGRFLRIPVVAEGASDGLPAGGLALGGQGLGQPLSAVALGKRAALASPAGPAAAHLAAVPDGMEAIVHHLERAVHVAAVYITSAADDVPGGDVRTAAALDACAARAFAAAIERARTELAASDGAADLLVEGQLPVAGLTVTAREVMAVCEGRVALTFARCYLEAWEEATAGDAAAGALGGLAGAAGVAIAAANYPVRLAMQVAQEAAESEAATAQGSAVAFAVLTGTAKSLQQLRAAARSLSPYLVGMAAHEPGPQQRWQDLERRVAALRRPDVIPRALVHDLREGLALGADAARDQLQAALRRHADNAELVAALEDLAGGPEPLAGLPDAMAALEFLPMRGA